MATIITSHNRHVSKLSVNAYGCNCRVRNCCPLDKAAQIIYPLDVSNISDYESKFYYGLTEISFKERYGNHRSSFRHERSRHVAELSRYVWKLHEQGKEPKTI